MSMKRNITIDGQEVAFKASAAIPRIYRMRFHRDIYKDLLDLEKATGDQLPSERNSERRKFFISVICCRKWFFLEFSRERIRKSFRSNSAMSFLFLMI